MDQEARSKIFAPYFTTVVDDELFMRDLVSQSLIQAGYRVETFSNGLEAWLALAQRPREWGLLIADRFSD